MFAFLASFLASAFGTTVLVSTVKVLTTLAFTAATTAYSISSSRRAARRMAAAYSNSIQDRTVTIRSADSARPILYGRVRVGGTVVYAIQATETQPTFFLVLALAGHECDALEAVYVGDERYDVGPGGELRTNGGNSRFYRTQTVDNTQTFTVDGSRRINLGPGAQCLSLTVARIQSSGEFQAYAFEYIPLQFVNETDSLGKFTGIVQIPSAQPNELVTVTFRVQTIKAWIRVKFYAGTADQQADQELITFSPTALQTTGGLSGGGLSTFQPGKEWTAEHRLRGVCYAVVAIDPDPEVFAETGLPEFSFVIRGKKVTGSDGTTRWSRNPAEILRDYLLSYARWPANAVNSAAWVQAISDCNQLVFRDETSQHARYTCDVVLAQDESSHRDNVQTLLSAMVGTLTPEGGQVVMRAGVWRAPTLTLTDDHMVGPAVVTGFQRYDTLFSAVRGRFFDGEESASDTGKTWQRVNFPPYVSSLFSAQDGGRIEYDDVELACTTDPIRAQRIAKLHLFRSRQALRISATWKLAALGTSPGRNVRLQLSRYGWATAEGGLGKTFRVDEMEVDIERGLVTATMQEEAQAVFDAEYSEFIGGDPAPNTTFPTWRDIAAPVGLQIETGSKFVRRRPDGTREPFARVTWTQVTDPSVLAGGWLDIEYRVNDATDWVTQPRLDPYQTAFIVPIVTVADVVHVRLRAANLLAVSPWTYLSTVVSATAGVPTSLLPLGMATNALPEPKLNGAVTPTRWQTWFTSANQFAPLSDNGVLLTGGVSQWVFNRNIGYSTSYGVIEATEVPIAPATGFSGTRGDIICTELFPVKPGDIWELQCWVLRFNIAAVPPYLAFFNASGAFISSSLDADKLPIVTDANFSMPILQWQNLQSYRRTFAFVRVPPGAVTARFAVRLFVTSPNPGQTGHSLRILMPFAGKSYCTSEAALRASPLTFVSDWNG
jgi:hypothetical protein